MRSVIYRRLTHLILLPRRKRREINIRAEVEVSVGSGSRDQRHSRDMGMGE
jgi:hypothetical protein